jgi:hypothetical protein
VNCLVVFKLGPSDESIGELGKRFNFRRIALDPDQITRVESRSYGITHDVLVSWKSPNVETISIVCSNDEEAIKLQDTILQVIHDARFYRRQQYG